MRSRRAASPSSRWSARTAAASGVPIRSSTAGIARRGAVGAAGPRAPREAGRRAASRPRRGRRGLLGERGPPSCASRSVANGAAPCRAAARIAVRATSSSSSCHQAAQRVLERQRQPLREAGRLEARPPAGLARLRDHRREERLGRLEPLAPSRASTATTAARTEKSGKSPRSLQPGERVHVRVAREVEERLGPAPRAWGRAAAPRLAAGPTGRPPRSGSRGRDGAPRGPRGSSRPRTAGCAAVAWRPTRQHVEGVQDLLRVDPPEPGREHLGRLPVEQRRWSRARRPGGAAAGSRASVAT